MIQIQLYNTATRKKEIFKPLDANRVTLYACGPTVYNYIHVGNARMLAVFDTLYRTLKQVYPRVVYARNITDIDDKIMQQADKENTTWHDVAQRYTAALLSDCDALNMLTPDHQPKATEFLAEMVAMIQDLINNGHAYEAQGHVLFDVPSYPAYGALSGRNRDEQIAGARVDVAPYKKDPADFVLWKPSTPNQPGWPSPWGRGRPGWHIECSAMATKLLGKDFDIHGGGQDLTFPHHENEIAQSCCANPQHGFARVWMHNGFLTVNAEKMSKSLGNFWTMHDARQQFDAEVVRYLLLSGHYRQPLDFSFEALEEAKKNLDKFYKVLAQFDDLPKVQAAPEVLEALADDLNTPKAYAVLHGLVNEFNKTPTPQLAVELAAQLKASAQLLGLLYRSPSIWLKGDVDEALVANLIAQRNTARSTKDFAKADALRGQLADMGVAIDDTATGTSWRKM